MTPLDMIVFWLCLITAARLLTYRRRGARFKRSISVVSWISLQFFIAMPLLLLNGKLCMHDLPVVTLPALMILSYAIFRARGNIAELIRSAREITS